MSAQSQETPAPQQAIRREEAAPETAAGPGNQALVDASRADPAGQPRGGSRYTIRRGDTLYSIAEAAYGDGRYWKDILLANPKSAFNGGDRILVGDVLVLPVVEVPQGASEPEATAATRPAVEPVVEEGAENTDEVVGDVGTLLAYDTLDWAITDEDATAALERLASLKMAALKVAVSKIDVGTLLDNLPGSAVHTPEFCKVAVAVGPERVAPLLGRALTRDMFHWAVTADDAAAVLDVLGALDPESRGKAIPLLDRDLQVRWLRTLVVRGSALTPADEAVLSSMFDRSQGDLDLLTLAFSVRFGLEVRGDGVEWDEAGLRQSWVVLESLPAVDTTGNPGLEQWIREVTKKGKKTAYAGGEYDDSSGAGTDSTYHGVSLNYDAPFLDTPNSSESDLDQDGMVSPEEQDPLHGVNRFDKVVRHEVGHAVDDALNGAARYCIGKPGGGDWIDYGEDAARCIEEMIDAANAGIARSPARAAIVAQLVADTKPSEPQLSIANIQALPEYQALSAEEQAAVDEDPVLSALEQAVHQPWYKHSTGGTPFNGRIYQRSYPYQWTSYAAEARARKVSQYQFRAPSEWFAEAYAAYYQPKSDGTCDHSTLGTIDPDTKDWFDANVDSRTRHA